MSGIIEKGNNGLFENEIEFTGKYATYARFLRDEAEVFSTFREIYLMSAIIGFVENKKGTLDNTELKVSPASIFAADLAKKRRDLKFIYRTIMLLNSESNSSIEERKNRAFKEDRETNATILKENMALFHSYVCGGLEYLYQQFDDVHDLDDKVNRLHELFEIFSLKNGIIQEEGLPSYDSIR